MLIQFAIGLIVSLATSCIVTQELSVEEIASSCIVTQELSVEEILDNVEAVDVSSLTATVSYTRTDAMRPAIKNAIRFNRFINFWDATSSFDLGSSRSCDPA